LQRVSEIANASHVGRANLHSHRLKVEALQNLLKMADCNGNKFVKELGELKDAIGEWHDWEELRVIAQEVLNHGCTMQANPGLKKNSEQKYKKALALFEQPKKKHLHSSIEATISSGTPLKKPAESVLSATAAIAA
jgi:CHAD domain-containing protein